MKAPGQTRRAASPGAALGKSAQPPARPLAAPSAARGLHRFGAYAIERPGDNALPPHVRRGIEGLGGVSLDDVRVHYRSPEPARVDAQAFTRGNVIHVAPGAEHHLAHEAWHVVQQRKGRVRATARTATGQPLNDDEALEREADVMAKRAVARPTG